MQHLASDESKSSGKLGDDGASASRELLHDCCDYVSWFAGGGRMGGLLGCVEKQTWRAMETWSHGVGECLARNGV